ncbi:hypothetical protein UA08_03685 [Talaromyces atroroseus]|uniref:Uncharacterized protein n=1 Tax=Talaromyces atroroseus TaxID=1441469 RepID=A0A225APJ4_TALAT|nr:hypothetical protein UA08_03685 [Talaromyces atroroseus]OKL61413.1 hypothetical protein UA08_03685 [Talaromyces atroroseus]
MASFLVTGAEFVRQLAAKPESEVKLVLATSRAENERLKELTEQYAGRVVFVPLTVGDETSMRNAVPIVEATLKEKGLNGLDVLINNAGIVGWTHAKEMADLDEVFHVNVTGPHTMIQAFLPLLRKGNDKKVINISSSVGSIARQGFYKDLLQGYQSRPECVECRMVAGTERGGIYHSMSESRDCQNYRIAQDAPASHCAPLHYLRHSRLARADFFPRDGSVGFTSNNEDRSNIALSFKIDEASDSLVVCGTGRVPLSRPAELSPEQQQEEEYENDGRIRLETLLRVSAPAGDHDGVNMPWFDTADAILMFHFIHRDEALVNLHVLYALDGGTLEVWPGGDDWTRPLPLQNEHPLLSLTLDSSSNEHRVLAANTPPPPLSSSPSPTYPIRCTVFMVLAPLTIAGMGIYMSIVLVLYAVLNLFFRLFWVLAFSLLVYWLYKRRPPVDDFVHEVIDGVAGGFVRVRDWLGRSLSSREEQQDSHAELESKG